MLHLYFLILNHHCCRHINIPYRNCRKTNPGILESYYICRQQILVCILSVKINNMYIDRFPTI